MINNIWSCGLSSKKSSRDQKYLLEFFKNQIKVHEGSGGNISNLGDCVSKFFDIVVENDSNKLAVLNNIMSVYIKKGNVEQKDRDYFKNIIDKVLDQQVHKKQSANTLEIDKFINAMYSFCAQNNYTKSVVFATDKAKEIIGQKD